MTNAPNTTKQVKRREAKDHLDCLAVLIEQKEFDLAILQESYKRLAKQYQRQGKF
jgi:hypothetical protein|tara:strand:- start:1586 stop:1750 length:165 start_codon:yes stop_codon:yes gene_type:complete